ncbi:zinc-ribbon domain-containing protein [Bifidobacterium longum]|uniref:zinc-ribbon domain-containing protein n=1 Tax=Bifidobacterium longum TaxID=216816 RepID=UPI00117F3A28
MNCDRCGAANDDRSRFCTECGAPLAPKLAVGHNTVTDVPPVPMPPAGPIPGPRSQL